MYFFYCTNTLLSNYACLTSSIKVHDQQKHINTQRSFTYSYCFESNTSVLSVFAFLTQCMSDQMPAM